MKCSVCKGQLAFEGERCPWCIGKHCIRCGQPILKEESYHKTTFGCEHIFKCVPEVDENLWLEEV